MIKIDRDIQSQKIIEKIIDARNVLEEEKSKKNGQYNKPEVVEALKKLCGKKCYICENKNITTYNIEHLRPHKNINLDLKFNFNNLLLVCAHCNNIKSDKYEHLLDCSEIDIDECIAFRRKGDLVCKETIEITPLDTGIEIDETVDLLDKVYNGTTELKKLESANIRKELRNEISRFIDMINEYLEAEDEDKDDARDLVLSHLKARSSFTAFKRWIIRDNREYLNEFLEDDGMKINFNI